MAIDTHTQNDLPRTPDSLQRVVDQAAVLNLFASPTRIGRSADSTGTPIHRFDIEMPWPTKGDGVRVSNRLSEPASSLKQRLTAIPHNHKALPGRQSPRVEFDSNRSQRFAFEECTFCFGSAGSFDCFGTGRTYPMMLGGRPQLAAAAVADITHGTGIFHGLPGNLTFCGVLTEDRTFCGHIILRIIDQHGVLRDSDSKRDDKPGKPLGIGLTFLNFVGQKGHGTDQANSFSQRGDGSPRGLNISTELKQARVGFRRQDKELRVDELETGAIIGREVGFGPLPAPGMSSEGIPLRPFPFEGVARYSFHDRDRETVGAITTNVTEGRRIDIRFEKVPDEVGFRFGFFGPIISGTGCFHCVQGLFYGASASFLTPPPGQHVVTHFYAAMLGDPVGRYRV